VNSDCIGVCLRSLLEVAQVPGHPSTGRAAAPQNRLRNEGLSDRLYPPVFVDVVNDEVVIELPVSQGPAQRLRAARDVCCVSRPRLHGALFVGTELAEEKDRRFKLPVRKSGF
jgi:hypothetical protein